MNLCCYFGRNKQNTSSEWRRFNSIKTFPSSDSFQVRLTDSDQIWLGDKIKSSREDPWDRINWLQLTIFFPIIKIGRINQKQMIDEPITKLLFSPLSPLWLYFTHSMFTESEENISCKAVVSSASVRTFGVFVYLCSSGFSSPKNVLVCWRSKTSWASRSCFLFSSFSISTQDISTRSYSREWWFFANVRSVLVLSIFIFQHNRRFHNLYYFIITS